jgi:DNA-binding NarL/FixJ family response regulator
MPARFSTCGPKHLARKNYLAAAQDKLSALRNILLVDTGHLEAERLTATLRVLFGYKAQIRTTSSLADAVDRIETEHPSVVFLDDVAQPPDAGADEAIAMLRKAGCSGPIVVVSETATPARRARLLNCGASEVIHRDDIDSVSLAEALACPQAQAVDEKNAR